MVNIWPFKQSNKPSEAEIAAAKLAARQKWVGKTLVGRVTHEIHNGGYGWVVTDATSVTGTVEKVGACSVVVDGVGYELNKYSVGGIEVIEVLE